MGNSPVQTFEHLHSFGSNNPMSQPKKRCKKGFMIFPAQVETVMTEILTSRRLMFQGHQEARINQCYSF